MTEARAIEVAIPGMMNAIEVCDVCGGSDLVELLDLGAQPLCDDLLPIGSDVECQQFPIILLGCPECFTVHQKYQIEKKVLFPESYHYRAALTQDVLNGMAELVGIAKSEAGGDLSGKLVLDIGCNDGSLLQKMREEGATTIGIEPTGAAHDAEKRVHCVFKQYFDDAAVDAYLAKFPKPDFITFTNVFAHISDLNAVLENLKKLIGPHTSLIVENHYLGAVADRCQFDTFYHEHPRTYSQRSFEIIAERLGLKIAALDFPQRYNGNIRVVMAASGKGAPQNPGEGDFFPKIEQMTARVQSSRDRFCEKVNPYIRDFGPLPAKAFPGRASIIIAAYEIDEKTLSAAYERPNSPKNGHLIPGTRIPILSEDVFFDSPTGPVIVNLAWHIHDEIHRYIRSKGFTGEIIDVFEA